MTIPTVTVASLKKVKNTVIGNPLAKVQLVRDGLFVSTLIDCLNPQIPGVQSGESSQDALRIEAAYVIASLSYGSEEALGTLLHANAPHAFIYAISNFKTVDSPSLRLAFSRALRPLASFIADVVGPSLWGLRPEKSIIRSEAQQALDYLFQNESLDIYLPLLLVQPSMQSSKLAIPTSTAQLLATTIRSDVQRRAITEWLPPSDRQREVKSRRGWEKSASSAAASSPWVARQLVTLLGEGQRAEDYKLIEAALSALAALARENSVMAVYLGKPSDYPPPLATILAFTKSRSVDVQLAACLCVTHILRALPPTMSHPPSAHPTSPVSVHSSSFAHSHIPASNHPPLEDNCARTVMNVVNRMLASPPPIDSFTLGSSGCGLESHQTKTRACYILHHLVSDNAALCHAAFDRGCLDYLGNLIRSINPKDTTLESEEGEPESLACLREAALTALASLALYSDDIRRRITDELALLPCISRALRSKRHVGTRYAACQCVRAMSRAVSVLRTSIVDSGLGMDVLRIVLGQELGDKFGGSSASAGVVGSIKGKDGVGPKARNIDRDEDAMDVENAGLSGKGKGMGEDRRVLGAALSAVCNIVNDFSPLRPIYLEEKLMPRLVYIIRESDDPPLRLAALWAVKNLVRKTSKETKRDIMSHLGWAELAEFLSDGDEDMQEQGFTTLRNLAEDEDGIAMVFRELGPQLLFSKVVLGLRSSNEDVVLNAAFALANLANGTHEQQDLILHHPGMLNALQTCLAEGTATVRRPAVSCVLTLVQHHPRRRKEMMDAGIVGTLKRLCEWAGHGQPHGGHVHPHAGGIGIGVTTSPSVATTAGAAGGGGATTGSRWGGRSPVRSPSFSNPAASAGVYGSWAGSGSMHHHSYSLAHPGNAGGLGGAASYTRGWGAPAWPSHMALEDDRDVVQRARRALQWLENGETYTA